MLALVISIVIICVGMLMLRVWISRKAKGGPIGAARHYPTHFQGVLREAGGQPVRGAFMIERDGVVYRFRYLSNSEGPSHIRVDRPIEPTYAPGVLPELPVMKLREENDRDRLGKALRLNRELQTGDQLFDARIYVECDDRGGAGAKMLASPEVRSGVTGLLALGFQFVGFRMQESALMVSWQVGAAPFNKRVVEQTVDRLAQIANNLPDFRRVPTSSRMSFGGWVLTGAWVLTGLAMFALLTANSNWKPLGSGLDWPTVHLGLLLLLLHAGLVWALVRGHSRALRHLFWGGCASLLFAPCVSRAVLVGYNGAGDTEITTYERILDHKRRVESDDSTSYYFYFPAVPGVEDSSMKLSVTSRQFRAATQGDLYLLTVGAGKLDTPWLLELERAGTQR